MTKNDRSVCGLLVKRFFRVTGTCSCDVAHEFVIVTWFPFPDYPDGTPLYVRIVLNGMNVNTLTELTLLVPLYSTQPSRIGVEIGRTNDSMIILRVKGVDKIPT